MSATTDMQAALDAARDLVALVGKRIVSDRAEIDWPRPFIVYSGSAEPDYGLNGEVLACLTTFSLQCCADTRRAAEAVADAATRALEDVATVTARTTGFSANLDVELVTLTVEWWEAD